MVVKVFSRLGQRHFSGVSLAGDSLPVRLRSVTIGLVGLVAAVGLGLVAMIYQQSWPGVFSGPLPQAPAPGLVHNDTIALGVALPQPAAQEEAANLPPPASQPQAAAPPADGSQLNVSQQAAPPAGGTGQAIQPPKSHSGTGGGGSPASPEPATSPAVSTPVAGTSQPPVAEGSTAPVVPEPEDESPGKSGQAPGHSGRAPGPPPWAGSASGASPDAAGGHGKPSWAGH